MEENNVKTVIINGGGLVGSLCAIMLAQKGFQVKVFEKRDDLRTAKIIEGRSINLALSHRGRKALRLVNLEKKILETGIPMKGRFLHELTGDTKSIPYDPNQKQAIYSISRNFLNKTLLEAVSQYSNVKLFFNHKLISCDFQQGSVRFENTKNGEITNETADLMIGADGAFSVMRRFMQQTPLFQFSQSYIEHGYLELCVPPENGRKMTPNHLHIWPRGQFMMIALPNNDFSWTVTLFMPFKIFESLKTPTDVIEFFQKTFPDSLPLIGESALVRDFFKSKPSSLISVKCFPYHVNSKFLLIGDAAHAMVPFYGQGMNAGFEDCSILSALLDQFGNDLGRCVREFSELRKDNVHAICDMAMYNYLEMRDLVTRPSYQIRKKVDDFLFTLLPEVWIPLYNSVSFSTMDYSKCMANRKWQDKVIRTFLILTMFFVALVLIFFTVYVV